MRNDKNYYTRNNANGNFAKYCVVPILFGGCFGFLLAIKLPDSFQNSVLRALEFNVERWIVGWRRRYPRKRQKSIVILVLKIPVA